MALLKKIPFEIYIVFIWIISILLVNPLGNFPLNDDWAYAKSVKNLCEHGYLSVGEWPAMTLVGQILPGALICQLFGFSFEVLRFYTLIVSLIGILTFYNIAKSLSANKRLTAFATLLVFFHPLYFSLSFSFMTDVHFLTTMLISIFFFNKYLLKRGVGYIILATLFSVACTMIRQPGILIPLGFTCIVFVKRQKFLVKIYSSIPLIITLFSLVIHSKWLKQIPTTSSNIVELTDLSGLFASLDLYQILVRVCLTILYIGLFSFPIVILFWKRIKTSFQNSKKVFLIISIMLIILLLVGGVHFPTGNIFYNLGLGPKLLKDGFWGENIYPHINHNLWVILLKFIGIIACLGITILLVGKVLSRKKQILFITYLNAYPLIFLISFIAAGYICLLIINSSYFDRYTIPLFAFLLLILLPINNSSSKSTNAIATLALILFAFFSIAATHEYLSWNRARWQAVNYLMDNKKIEPFQIDGGFEFNAWHKTAGTSAVGKSSADKSWWFVKNDDFAITFGDVDGYHKVKGFYYPTILPGKNDSIYILEKSDKIK